MDPPLFLLPCDSSLVCGAYAGYSLCVLYSRRDGESGRMASWPPMAIRTSSISWSANEEGLHAECQSDFSSDDVVRRSDFFCPASDPSCALGMGLGHPLRQAGFWLCDVLGGRNVGEQLDEPDRGLFQGATCSKRSMIDRAASSTKHQPGPGTADYLCVV